MLRELGARIVVTNIMNDSALVSAGVEKSLYSSQKNYRYFDELKYSTAYTKEYLKSHTNEERGLAEDGAAVMGLARFNWLLEKSRHSLNGVFSVADIELCLNCFRGDLLSPERIRTMASSICWELDIDLDEYGDSEIAPLIDNLRDLSRHQLVAFADALEQMWHRGLPAEKGIAEFYGELGIELISSK